MEIKVKYSQFWNGTSSEFILEMRGSYQKSLNIQAPCIYNCIMEIRKVEMKWDYTGDREETKAVTKYC